MRFDSKLMFSDGQSISGTSGTSTNTLDLNKAGVSEGELYVILSVSGSALPTSIEVLGGSASASVTDTVATAYGTDTAIKLPQGCPRYLKLSFTGTAMSCKVTAGISLCASSPKGKRIGDYAAE